MKFSKHIHTKAHIHRTSWEDQVEHLQLKDPGREMEVSPRRSFFKVRILIRYFYKANF